MQILTPQIMGKLIAERSISQKH